MMTVQKGGTVDLVEVEEVHEVKYLRPWSIKKLPGYQGDVGRGRGVAVHVKLGFSVECYGGRLLEIV